MGYTEAFLLYASQNRHLFYGKDILTLGVLYPYCKSSRIAKIFQSSALASARPSEFSRILFLKVLGANAIRSLDISDYQGADIIHNLNTPIPQSLASQYDCILDLGTLEHISDVKQAFSNFQAMLRDGGLYTFAGVMNNWPGHGFFQFSPVFYFDLVAANSHLDLVDINIASYKKIAPIKSPSSFIAMLSRYTFQRVVIAGTIMFNDASEPLCFDFAQSSYASKYNKLSDSSLSSRRGCSIKRFFIQFLVSMAQYLPFSFDFKLTLYQLYSRLCK